MKPGDSGVKYEDVLDGQTYVWVCLSVVGMGLKLQIHRNAINIHEHSKTCP